MTEAEGSKIEYVDLPRGYFGKEFSGKGREKLSVKAVLMHGLISAYTAKSGGAFLTYDDFHDAFGLSSKTIAKWTGELETRGKIERDKSKKDYIKYTAKEKASRKSFIKYDKELLRVIDAIFGEPHFTPTEEIMLCNIVSIIIRKEENGEFKVGRYKAGYTGIQTQMNVSQSTARRMMKKFADLQIIILKESGKSKGLPNQYTLNSKLIKAWIEVLQNREAAKNEAIEKKSGVPEADRRAKAERKKAIQDADYRSDREHYYSVLGQKAEDTAYWYTSVARQHEEFKKIEAELSKLQIKLAKEKSDDEKAKLEEKELNLKVTRSIFLSKIGLSDEQLTPQYSCRKCNDTGYLPNGRICDCYPSDRGQP